MLSKTQLESKIKETVRDRVDEALYEVINDYRPIIDDTLIKDMLEDAIEMKMEEYVEDLISECVDEAIDDYF